MNAQMMERRRKQRTDARERNTQPERMVRSLLHRMGYRFRLHVAKLPGKPDIVLPKCKTVVFVHGCFWHRHPNCKYAYTPKSRQNFWAEKFRRNIERHSAVTRQLEELGWRVLVIWECELADAGLLASSIGRLLPRQPEPETTE